MTDFDDFDFDRSTLRAWSRLQSSLAVQLSTMTDEVVTVSAESRGRTDFDVRPFLTMAAPGPAVLVLLAGTSGDTGEQDEPVDGWDEGLTGLGLDPLEADGVDPDDEEGEDGLELDGVPTHSLAVGRDDAARLAVVAMRILRDVLGVPHPAFLQIRGIDVPSATDRAGDDDEAHEAIEVVVPQSRAHLEALVDDALLEVLDSVPERDADGDVPIVNGSAIVFVRVSPHAPAITLFAEVVSSIAHPDRAAFEVSVLNRDSVFSKWTVVDDRIIASVFLPAAPFVPAHLRDLLSAFAEEIDGVDDDLAARVGGRRFNEQGPLGEPVLEGDEEDREEEDTGDDEDTDDLHPAMLTLMQLEADAPGTTDPELAADICGYDRELILAFIRSCEWDEIGWRRSWEEAALAGDQAESVVCQGEMEQAAKTASLLRKALRIAAERERKNRRKGTRSE